MHIGIDTVALKGAGFTPRVKAGDHVEAGAPLIDFDLDHVATHAKSLLTQIVITNGESIRAMERASGAVKAGADTLLKLTLADGSSTLTKSEGTTVTSEAILIPNPTGLHARPAAVLANVAKKFQSEIKLQLGDRTANARSITSIMALEVGRGDKVVIVAKGADAKEATEKLSKLIADGLGDEGCAAGAGTGNHDDRQDRRATAAPAQLPIQMYLSGSPRRPVSRWEKSSRSSARTLPWRGRSWRRPRERDACGGDQESSRAARGAASTASRESRSRQGCYLRSTR
jgi:phosphotransferase system HPr (HPr) family protein